MRRTHLARIVLAVGALALVASACSNDDSADDTTTTEATDSGGSSDRGNVDGTLILGAMVPQTGDLNTIVESLQTPIDIAIEEINEAGGVNGEEVLLVEGDDGTSPTVAQTTYDQFVSSENVDAIIGPAPSSVAAVLAENFGTDKVPACSGSTTAANLTDAGDGFFFRTAPGDNLQGPALAELIASDNHTAVAIVARNDDYGSGFADSLGGALEESGIEVTETVLYNPDSGTGYDADVQRAVDSSPEAVVVIGFNDDGAQIINAMIGAGAGPADIPIYTADGMQGSSFGETVDPENPGVVAGIKGTAPAAAPAGIEHPFQAVFAATGVDTIFSPYYYDCTILMALAAQAAGSDDGTAIKDAFAANLEGDNDCQTFKECKELLEAGETIHYRGASSAFDSWQTMEPGTGVYDTWTYDAEGAVEDLGTQIPVGN
ncbi:MAG: ABC transporter substrate-binding protein [Microthrixaceae bacterium]